MENFFTDVRPAIEIVVSQLFIPGRFPVRAVSRRGGRAGRSESPSGSAWPALRVEVK